MRKLFKMSKSIWIVSEIWRGLTIAKRNYSTVCRGHDETICFNDHLDRIAFQLTLIDRYGIGSCCKMMSLIANRLCFDQLHCTTSFVHKRTLAYVYVTTSIFAVQFRQIVICIYRQVHLCT